MSAESELDRWQRRAWRAEADADRLAAALHILEHNEPRLSGAGEALHAHAEAVAQR